MSEPTGNPWEDHAASFANADRLRRAKKAIIAGQMPPVEDLEKIIALAIEAHDCMSLIGGGEIIELGPLAMAVFKLCDDCQKSSCENCDGIYPDGFGIHDHGYGFCSQKCADHHAAEWGISNPTALK